MKVPDLLLVIVLIKRFDPDVDIMFESCKNGESSFRANPLPGRRLNPIAWLKVFLLPVGRCFLFLNAAHIAKPGRICGHADWRTNK